MKRTYFFVLVLCVFMLPSRAHAYSAQEKQAAALDIAGLEEALPDSAEDVLGGEKITEGIDAEGVLKRLIQSGKAHMGEILRSSVISAAVLVFAAMLCSAASSIVKVKGLGELDYITLVGVIAVAALSFGGIRSFTSAATEVIDDMASFSKVLLPTITAAATAGGATASATAKYAAVTMFMDILISVINSLILPLIYAYMAAGIAAAAFGGDGLEGAASLIKWAATNILTVIVIAFTVFITVSGIVSGTADAAGIRLTKTVLSTALPVVGSIISDAAGTVLTGAVALRNAVGVFGLLAVAAICLVPFMKLGINYLIYKAASLLAASVADKNISKAIGSVSAAIGIALGAAGACAVMLFFSIISVMKAVGVL